MEAARAKIRPTLEGPATTEALQSLHHLAFELKELGGISVNQRNRPRIEISSSPTDNVEVTLGTLKAPQDKRCIIIDYSRTQVYMEERSCFGGGSHDSKSGGNVSYSWLILEDGSLHHAEAHTNSFTEINFGGRQWDFGRDQKINTPPSAELVDRIAKKIEQFIEEHHSKSAGLLSAITTGQKVKMRETLGDRLKKFFTPRP